MTIKWVKVDPLVMNGEPFCYGSRLTVRQLLELRRERAHAGGPAEGPSGAARWWASRRRSSYAADHRERYAEFFEPDGSLTRPGLHGGGGDEPPGALPDPGRRRQGAARRAARTGRVGCAAFGDRLTGP